MKTVNYCLLSLVLVTQPGAETPTELQAKAIEMIKLGNDNEAQAVLEKLLRAETPSDRGLPSVEPDQQSSMTTGVFGSLAKSGFRLQRDPGPASDAKPAEFAFTRSYLIGLK